MAYEYSDWTQIRVTVKVTMLDRVVAIMSMIDPNLMIEDMSDFQINNRYGELVDEALLNADKTVSRYCPSFLRLHHERQRLPQLPLR